jgi:hypothetical protein
VIAVVRVLIAASLLSLPAAALDPFEIDDPRVRLRPLNGS